MGSFISTDRVPLPELIPVTVVYYESLNRELQTKPVNECRCDERLQTRVSRMPSVGHGTGKPKDRDEVNRRDVSE